MTYLKKIEYPKGETVQSFAIVDHEYGSGEIWVTGKVNITLSNGTEIDDATIEITNEDLIEWEIVGDSLKPEEAIKIKLGLNEDRQSTR